jgi:hypothetical protein
MEKGSFEIGHLEIQDGCQLNMQIMYLLLFFG